MSVRWMRMAWINGKALEALSYLLASFMGKEGSP